MLTEIVSNAHFDLSSVEGRSNFLKHMDELRIGLLSFVAPEQYVLREGCLHTVGIALHHQPIQGEAPRYSDENLLAIANTDRGLLLGTDQETGYESVRRSFENAVVVSTAKACEIASYLAEVQSRRAQGDVDGVLELVQGQVMISKDPIRMIVAARSSEAYVSAFTQWESPQ